MTAEAGLIGCHKIWSDPCGNGGGRFTDSARTDGEEGEMRKLAILLMHLRWRWLSQICSLRILWFPKRIIHKKRYSQIISQLAVWNTHSDEPPACHMEGLVLHLRCIAKR
jgi:hypothetical protein